MVILQTQTIPDSHPMLIISGLLTLIHQFKVQTQPHLIPNICLEDEIPYPDRFVIPRSDGSMLCPMIILNVWMMLPQMFLVIPLRFPLSVLTSSVAVVVVVMMTISSI